MRNNEKEALRRQSSEMFFIKTVGRGLVNAFKTLTILVILAATMVVGFIYINAEYFKELWSFPLPVGLLKLAILALLVLFILVFLYAVGRPWKAHRMESDLRHVRNFLDATDESPCLVAATKKEKNERIRIYEFETYIPLCKWRDRREELESALNLNIIDIYKGKDNRRIIIEAVPPKYMLGNYYEWDDSKCPAGDSELTTGMKLGGLEVIDLNKTPHALIGGSTGSGKSFLLKILLRQCVLKHAAVYIADFKGGVDFSPWWKQNTVFVTDENNVIAVLESLVKTIEERKILFNKYSTANLKAYVAVAGSIGNEPPQRHIFACDEVAEMLDKTGADKERREIIQRIEYLLSVIARQGRAFGVHLMLATQRPDANILAGQIKNNIDYRICGRADDVLSKIILDNTEASNIPKTAQGRFILHDGTEIQGFYCRDE